MLFNKLTIIALWVLIPDLVKFASIDPKVPAFDGGSESSIFQQDLLHSLSDLLVDPEIVRLIAFAPSVNVPSVVFSRLHHREKDHKVEVAKQCPEDLWLR